MARIEAKFTTDLRVALERLSAWAYKIPDAPINRFHRCSRCGQVDQRYGAAIERPFDVVGCLHGRALAIEVKQLRGFKAFGTRLMQPSQVSNLSAIEQAGGVALVALFVHEPRVYRKLLLFVWSALRERWASGSIRKAELEALRAHNWSRPAGRVLSWLPMAIQSPAHDSGLIVF